MENANNQTEWKVVGCDFYNFQCSGLVSKTLNCAATDKDHVGGVILIKGSERHRHNETVNGISREWRK